MESPHYQYNVKHQYPKKNRMRNALIIGIFCTVVVGGVVFVVRPWDGFSLKSADEVYQVEGGTVSSDETAPENMTYDIDRILEKLSKHILVPQETPVIYTISNADELVAQQAFFAGSQNGDVLLIFQKQVKAIIYSEARDIIVNVGPLSYTDELAQ